MNKQKIFILTVNLFWFLLAYLIFTSSIKDSIVIHSEIKKFTQYFFPEGWGFFTKDPKEALVDIYKVEDGTFKNISIMNVEPKNYLGFSRIARVKGYELSMILSTLSVSNWQDNKVMNLENHLKDTTFEVKTKEKYKYFNSGTYFFVQRQPVPWAWANSNQEKYAPTKSIKVKIN